MENTVGESKAQQATKFWVIIVSLENFIKINSNISE